MANFTNKEFKTHLIRENEYLVWYDGYKIDPVFNLRNRSKEVELHIKFNYKGQVEWSELFSMRTGDKLKTVETLKETLKIFYEHFPPINVVNSYETHQI